MAFANASGAAADPGTVTLKIRRENGLETTHVYGTDANVIKDSTGNYHYDIVLDQHGVWFFRWEGTVSGPIQADEVRIIVEGSPFEVATSPVDPIPAGGLVDQVLKWTALGPAWGAVNLASAVAVTGLLALTHLAPGTNGQFLSTVGGVATWVAAPVATPGGSSGEVQYNNAGAFDGASGIKVVGSETALAYGATPAGLGTQRYTNLQTVYVRNAANTQNLRVLEMGDDLSIGDLTAGGFTFYDVGSGKSHVFRVAGTTEYEATAIRFDLRTNYIVHGTNYSTNGVLNAENAVVLVGARNAANTGDIEVIKTDNVDKVFLGGSVNTAAVVTSSKVGGFWENRVNNVAVQHFDNTNADFLATHVVNAASVRATGTVAASGFLRGAHNTVQLAVRNGANTQDLPLVECGSVTDRLVLGNVLVATMVLAVATGGAFDCRINNVSAFTVDANKTFIANSGTPPSSDPSGGGYLYEEAGALKHRGSSGTVETLGAA